MAVRTSVAPLEDDPALLEPAATGALRALRESPAFRRLWCGALTASLGQWMQATALGWLALELTDSASFVGFVAFAAGLPFLLVSVPGGALIDRFNRQRVLIAGQSLAVGIAVFIALDIFLGMVQPWHLIVGAFANGSIQAITNPTQQSLVPSLVPRASLTNAIGLMSAGQNMTRVVGPTVSGALIGLIGTGAGFVCQAIALGVSVGLIASTTFPGTSRSSVSRTLTSMFDGVRVVLSRPDLRAIFLIASIPSFFVFPYISFLPVFARDILHSGPGGLGVLMASSGIGAVAGSVLVATRSQPATGPSLIAQMIAYGLVIVFFALSQTLITSIPFLFCSGLLGSSFLSANNALLQHQIEDEIRGRVMGAYMLTWGLMPLGALPMGLLAARTNTPLAVATGALISSVLAAMLYLRSPAIRNL